MYAPPQAPQSIGGVIDQSIELFKASFRSCWVAALVYAIVVGAIATWMQMGLVSALGTQAPNPLAALRIYQSPAFASGYLLILLLSLTFNLALVATIVDIARGREGGNALSRFGTVLPWLPGAVVVTILIMICFIVGLVLLVIPGVYLLIRWSLWMTALTDERRGSFAGLGTSWRLVGGNWWRTMVVLSVVGIVVFVLTLIFGFAGGLVAALLKVDLVTQLMLTQVLNGIGQVLYLPAISAALVAIYLDLKLRKDGADLEARLGTLGASPP